MTRRKKVMRVCMNRGGSTDNDSSVDDVVDISEQPQPPKIDEEEMADVQAPQGVKMMSWECYEHETAQIEDVALLEVPPLFFRSPRTGHINELRKQFKTGYISALGKISVTMKRPIESFRDILHQFNEEGNIDRTCVREPCVVIDGLSRRAALLHMGKVANVKDVEVTVWMRRCGPMLVPLTSVEIIDLSAQLNEQSGIAKTVTTGDQVHQVVAIAQALQVMAQARGECITIGKVVGTLKSGSMRNASISTIKRWGRVACRLYSDPVLANEMEDICHRYDKLKAKHLGVPVLLDLGKTEIAFVFEGMGRWLHEPREKRLEGGSQVDGLRKFLSYYVSVVGDIARTAGVGVKELFERKSRSGFNNRELALRHICKSRFVQIAPTHSRTPKTILEEGKAVMDKGTRDAMEPHIRILAESMNLRDFGMEHGTMPIVACQGTAIESSRVNPNEDVSFAYDNVRLRAGPKSKDDSCQDGPSTDSKNAGQGVSSVMGKVSGKVRLEAIEVRQKPIGLNGCAEKSVAVLDRCGGGLERGRRLGEGKTVIGSDLKNLKSSPNCGMAEVPLSLEEENSHFPGDEDTDDDDLGVELQGIKTSTTKRTRDGDGDRTNKKKQKGSCAIEMESSNNGSGGKVNAMGTQVVREVLDNNDEIFNNEETAAKEWYPHGEGVRFEGVPCKVLDGSYAIPAERLLRMDESDGWLDALLESPNRWEVNGPEIIASPRAVLERLGFQDGHWAYSICTAEAIHEQALLLDLYLSDANYKQAFLSTGIRSDRPFVDPLSARMSTAMRNRFGSKIPQTLLEMDRTMNRSGMSAMYLGQCRTLLRSSGHVQLNSVFKDQQWIFESERAGNVNIFMCDCEKMFRFMQTRIPSLSHLKLDKSRWNLIRNRNADEDVADWGDGVGRWMERRANVWSVGQENGDGVTLESWQCTRTRVLMEFRVMLLLHRMNLIADWEDEEERLEVPSTGGRFMFSSPGCKRQYVHADTGSRPDIPGDGISYDYNPGYSVIISGLETVNLWVCKKSSEKMSTGVPDVIEAYLEKCKVALITLPPLSLLVFRGDLLHAGDQARVCDSNGFCAKPNWTCCPALRYHIPIPRKNQNSNAVHFLNNEALQEKLQHRMDLYDSRLKKRD